MRSAGIRSFSGPYFPSFGLNTKRYGVSLRKRYGVSPYAVRMRENTEQKNSEHGHFSRSVKHDPTLKSFMEIQKKHF